MIITEEDAFLLLRKQVTAFTKITDADWKMLSPSLELKHLRKGELFIAEGKRANEIGLVINGMLRQFYTKDGEEKTTYFFFEPHFISAYISCITGKPSLLTIEALSEVTYVSFPFTAMQALFDSSIAWQKFARLIAEYTMIGLEERMVSLLLQSPEERYVDLLNSNKSKIIERIPQHYIANYLGITPVSMSRIRKRLLKK
jgi:CRP-like cAMP-binding protein